MKRKVSEKRIPAVLLAALFLACVFPGEAGAVTEEEAWIALGPGVFYDRTAQNPASPPGSPAALSAEDRQKIGLNGTWQYAEFSVIRTGEAVLYRAQTGRKNKTVAVGAGHGTAGGETKKTYSHPDRSPKVTGGTNARGAVMSTCVSSGMVFRDGTPESRVTLRMAQILRGRLLAQGYDVLMLRDGEDVQLDNVARTVIANNSADIHIALHWDGDGLSTIKGAFYMSVPDALKAMEPVKSHWQEHERLGDALILGLETKIPGIRIYSSSGHGQMDMDLTQTSYSTIPSVDIELGNQCSDHSDPFLNRLADGLAEGISGYFSKEQQTDR